jgi:hypothetical protein
MMTAVATNDDFPNWSIKELREMSGRIGLGTSGSRAELIERLSDPENHPELTRLQPRVQLSQSSAAALPRPVVQQTTKLTVPGLSEAAILQSTKVRSLAAAYQLAAGGHVEDLLPHKSGWAHAIVRGGSNYNVIVHKGSEADVDSLPPTECTCPDYLARGSYCKHSVAVLLRLAELPTSCGQLVFSVPLSNAKASAKTSKKPRRATRASKPPSKRAGPKPTLLKRPAGRASLVGALGSAGCQSTILV